LDVSLLVYTFLHTAKVVVFYPAVCDAAMPLRRESTRVPRVFHRTKTASFNEVMSINDKAVFKKRVALNSP
jgi:hypothetical protein